MSERKFSAQSNTTRKSNSSDSNPTLDQVELEPFQNDMCDYKSCTCSYCNLPIGEWEHISCTTCNLTYHLACVNPFTEDDTPDTWYCSDCVNAKPIQSATEEEPLAFELDARNTPENPVRTDPLEVCKICRGPEESGEPLLACGSKACTHKYYHMTCLKKCQIPNATQADKQSWYCPSCLCHHCLASKDDHLLVPCAGCGEAYHTYCMNLPKDSVANVKWYCNNCHIEKEREGIREFERENEPENSEIYEPMKMLICALESLEAQETLAI
jgi:PHD-finger